MIKPSKIIVVGGNAAGPAAAAKAKRVNPDAEVIMFESGEYISTGTCEIPYVLSGDISGFEELVTFSPGKFMEEKGVKTFTGCVVTGINRERKYVTVYNSKMRQEFEERYDSLILATGSLPKKIPDFPEFAPNLFTLKNISDLTRVIEFLKLKDVNSVAVIGSGYIGIEAADAFHVSGKELILIEKEKLPLPYTEPEVRLLISELLKKKNILFVGGYRKFSVYTEKGFIRSINIDGRIIEPGIVISAVGFTPNNALARAAGLKITSKGAVKVDNKLRTSDSSIWACGDNVEIINLITGRNDYYPVATIAHDFGHVAGENAAGGMAMVSPVIKNIAIKILDRFQVSVGITEKESKENGIPCKIVQAAASNLVKIMPDSELDFGKIVYHAIEKNILGAAFFGGKEVSGFGNLISVLIKLKVPAGVLTEINYNYTPPLSPLINLLSILGRQVK